jgi:hypothetical protein
MRRPANSAAANRIRQNSQATEVRQDKPGAVLGGSADGIGVGRTRQVYSAASVALLAGDYSSAISAPAPSQDAEPGQCCTEQGERCRFGNNSDRRGGD